MALTDNLTHYWKLDESSGDASDSVGSLTLVNTAATYSTGKINNGAVFNGTTAGMITSDFSGGSDWSVSGWFKPSSTSDTEDIFDMDKVTGNQRVFDIIRQNDNTIIGLAWSSSHSLKVTSAVSSGMSAGTWYYVTATWSASNNAFTVYINASSVTSVSVGSSGAETTATPFTIGYRADGANHTNCSIDEVGYWTRALTGAEITELYAAGSPGSGQQYPFSSGYTGAGFMALKRR